MGGSRGIHLPGRALDRCAPEYAIWGHRERAGLAQSWSIDPRLSEAAPALTRLPLCRRLLCCRKARCQHAPLHCAVLLRVRPGLMEHGLDTFVRLVRALLGSTAVAEAKKEFGLAIVILGILVSFDLL